MALTKITRGVIKANENYDTHNINSTGIITAVSANFTGNVSIGGTLTYQDVTNIDSVGIITAQSDISIADKIVHTGDTNTALRFPAADTITAETGGTERLRIKSDGAAYFSGNLGLGGQISPGAPIHLHNFGNDGYELKITGNAVQFNRSSNSYIDQLHNSGSILFRMTSSHTEAMRITSAGKVLINSTANSDAQLLVKSADKLHPVLKFDGLSANGFSLLGDEYQTDESHFTMGIAYSSASLVTGWGVKVSPTASNEYLSSQDTYSTKHSAVTHDGDGWKFLSNSSSQTVTTDSVVSLTERLRITSDGKVGIGEDTPDGLLVIKGDSNGASNPSIRLKDGSDTREAWISNASGDLILANGGNDNTPHCKITMFDGNILSVETANTERLRITNDGFFNFNQANNNNLQGRVTIFDGGNFSTSSTLGSGDSDNIYLISDATSGNNVYGSSIAWSRVQYADRRVAAIANVQTSTDEDHVGLAFFTHPSADATANIEEKFRITHDGIHITNGVSNFYVAFQLSNNQSYNWDIAVPNEGGYGNSFRVEAGYNHYYTTSYGSHRSAWVSTRGTSLAVMFEQDQGHSQSGYWSFSKPNSTTFRVTKSAGSYGGAGYGFLHVRFNYF